MKSVKVPGGTMYNWMVDRVNLSTHFYISKNTSDAHIFVCIKV